MEVWLFRVVFVAAIIWFGVQMATRWKLFQRTVNDLSLQPLGERIARFLSEVVFQTKVIRAKPIVGLAHLFVFWGFVAFGGFTTVEMLRGLGLVDLTETRAFALYKWALLPFCLAVLVGIVALAIRRGVLRPAALGATVSKESILIAFFIMTLMVTFLVQLLVFDRQPGAHGVAERANWWTHMLVILAFLGLIPDSKHLHLLLSPIDGVPEVADARDRADRSTSRRRRSASRPSRTCRKKAVLDAFTCVECGRCQENCPGLSRRGSCSIRRS